MTHIELVIWTGKQDSVIVDLGPVTANEEMLGLALDVSSGIDDVKLEDGEAGDMVPMLEGAILLIEGDSKLLEKYSLDDLLKAKQYLSKLRTACELHPDCRIRVGII
jgi:hypothetical protein